MSQVESIQDTRPHVPTSRLLISGTQLTVGVEEEFLLVDAETGQPAPSSALLLTDAAEAGVEAQQEITQFQIEANSPVCHTMGELHAELARSRADLAKLAAARGLRLLATGVPVVGPASPPILVDKPRYHLIAEHFGYLMHTHNISGCHIHIGMPDREHAVAVSNRLRPWLPVLLALSANSPISEGVDTGYASWRWLVWSRWPSAGPPRMFSSAADYDAAVDHLLAAGAALDCGMIYWDVRLSYHLPTIELRICDVAATAEDAVLLAALTRAIAATALAEVRAGVPAPDIDQQALRTALWRAAHDGIAGDCLDPWTWRMTPMNALIDRLVDYVLPALEAAGDRELVVELLTKLRANGCGATRQRRALASAGQLLDVIKLLAAQTAGKLA